LRGVGKGQLQHNWKGRLVSASYIRGAAGSENGVLLRLNMQYLPLEAGVDKLLLERPDIHIPYLTPTWLPSLRQFLFCHNMTITVSDSYTIPLGSDTDQYIMQMCHLERYAAAQQRDINLV
jgi:hypothetical protein